jgi:hypothetical protein
MIHRLLLLACILYPLSAWAACEGKQELFTEDFSEPDPTWAPSKGDWYKADIQDKKYIISIKPNNLWQDFPSAFVYSGDYKVCVTMTMPDEPTLNNGSGLAFWINPKKDADGHFELYRATLAPEGDFWISRDVAGQNTIVVPFKTDDSLKASKGRKYELEVSVTGNTGVFSVDGKQLVKFKGQPPPNSYAGVFASSPETYNKGDWTVEFQNFRVMK